MSTGTALVNARTPKLVPGEQEPTRFTHTPPELIAYLRGEQLSDADLSLIRPLFPNGELPVVSGTLSPQTAEDYPVAAARSALAGQPVKPIQRRLVVKRSAGAETPSPETLAADFVSSYIQACNDDLAYSYLLLLAKRFNMEIE